MTFVPGPDLPGGGKIIGLEGIRDAYETGRGAFRTRATARIEKVSSRREGIVITELPYLVGPERVIEKIKEAITAKRLDGVAAVTDLTDRHHGLRLVIEVKSGFVPESVLERLYQLTPLEETFGINNVALVDGEPQTLGLRELLSVWVGHRLEVVRRRSEYRLGARRDRLHLVDGLLIAILDIDEVIAIIRAAEDAGVARERLMTAFDLSELQAEYILELKLRRLTKFSRVELETEKARLLAEIADLEEILGSDAALRAVVGREMDAVAAEYGTPRRTILLTNGGSQSPAAASKGAQSARTPLEIADVPCFALLSATGLVARTSSDTPVARSGRRSAHDALRSVVAASARSDVGVVTSAGRIIRLSLLDVPALPLTSDPPSLGGGTPLAEVVSLERGEEALALVPLGGTVPLALGTAQGVVKRLAPEEAPGRESWEVIALRDGDTVVGATLASDDAELVFITSDAQLLRYSASRVRPQGRGGGGHGRNRGRGRAEGCFLRRDPPGFRADGSVDDAAPVAVTIAGPSGALPGTVPGTVKVTPLGEFPSKGRGTGGVRAHKFLKGEDVLLLAWAGHSPARAISSGGQAIPLPAEYGRRDASGTPPRAPIHGIG